MSQMDFPNPMGGQGGGGDGRAVAISSGIMVAAVIFLFLVVVFVFFFYLYTKRYIGANPIFGRADSRTRFIFVSELSPFHRRGLDEAVLRSLPVTAFRSADFEGGLECAVCLSEASEGEKVRLLPNCSHGFHVECIDMWFHSHSTCPLCRIPVVPEPGSIGTPGVDHVEIRIPEANSGDGYAPESLVFPTNVYFWGTLENATARGPPAAGAVPEGSSSSSSRSFSGKREGMLAIEIPPRRVLDGFRSPMSPLPSSRFAKTPMRSPMSPLPSSRMANSSMSPLPSSRMAMEEMKSPGSAKFRSLRRLLSRGKRTVEPSCSPGGGDIEKGLASGGALGDGSIPTKSKTPKSS